MKQKRQTAAEKQKAYRERSAEIRARDEVQAIALRQVHYMLERLQRDGVTEVTLPVVDLATFRDADQMADYMSHLLLKRWGEQQGKVKGTAATATDGTHHGTPPQQVQDVLSPKAPRKSRPKRDGKSGA